MEDSKLVEFLIGAVISGFVLVIGWSFKSVWNDKTNAIIEVSDSVSDLEDKLEVLIKEIEQRVNALEKTDAGVQVHLDSLAEVKKQLESVQNAVLNFVTHRGN